MFRSEVIFSSEVNYYSEVSNITYAVMLCLQSEFYSEAIRCKMSC